MSNPLHNPPPPTFDEALLCPNDGEPMALINENLKRCPKCAFVHGRSHLFVGGRES